MGRIGRIGWAAAALMLTIAGARGEVATNAAPADPAWEAEAAALKAMKPEELRAAWASNEARMSELGRETPKVRQEMWKLKREVMTTDPACKQILAEIEALRKKLDATAEAAPALAALVEKERAADKEMKTVLKKRQLLGALMRDMTAEEVVKLAPPEAGGAVAAPPPADEKK
jgi:chromosome segregation ATPase